MKKPYQIESLRAVKRLEEMAADGNPAVQLVLPMAEMVGRLHKGVGELVRHAGLQLIQLLMEEEVRHLVGERSRLTPERTRLNPIAFYKNSSGILPPLIRTRSSSRGGEAHMWGRYNSRWRPGQMKVQLRNAKSASEGAIVALETTLGCRLSPSFRAFLQSHDGAKPESNVFRISDNNSSGVDEFIPGPSEEGLG
jgi:hypothetical protein